MRKILVAEISGKRPGNVKQRPTEKFELKYDHVIISNNSVDYETDWPIINVPDDYVEWYRNNVKMSDLLWLPQMNRSYAIKYAREHGYDYCVQLDDNITQLDLVYKFPDSNGIYHTYKACNHKDMPNDFIDMMVCVLENTNAAMAGINLCGITVPSGDYLRERYCYSFFTLNLKTCPDIFHGSFEDDIEYRMKCAEMGLPVVQIAPMRYGKTAQHSGKDETGCRSSYTKAGLQRGAQMRKIHGDMYTCGYSKHAPSTNAKVQDGVKFFRHKIKAFKVGVLVKDQKAIDDTMLSIFKKYAKPYSDKVTIKEKKR